MDEIRSQLISRTQTTQPTGQTSLGAQTAKVAAPQTTNTGQTTNTSQTTNTAQTNNTTQTSHTTQTIATTSHTPSSQGTQLSQIQHVTQLLRNTAQVTVHVSSSQVLDNTARLVLAKVNPSLSHSLNTVQTPTTPLIQQTTAANTNPTLYLVKLTATGVNAGQTLLTTITPTAFKRGDPLQLQLNQQQQIVIKPSVASVRPAITEGLKTTLPSQQNVSQLLNGVNKLQQLPPLLQNALLNTSTVNQLQALNHFIKNQYSLSTAQQVKTTLHNSGLLTEQKIQTQQSLQGDLRASLGALLKSLPPTSSNTTEYAPQKTIELIVSHLLSTLTSHPMTKTASGDTLNLQQTLSGLLQLLGVKSSQHNHSDTKKIKDTIAQKLHQLANSSQEKIQLNQLRSLETNQNNDNSTAKLTAFNTEIPLRFGDQVLPLQLSIKAMPDKTQEENANAEDNKKTTRRWQVFLSFDLPSHIPYRVEQLHTQLIVVDNTVSATLWADSSLLCEKAKQQLALLRNNLMAKGLEVEDLLCINGKPPQQNMSLDYNLIDITT
jgi:hypothetical protein